MQVPPSQILGLTLGSYEAYCLDQAAWYLGITITAELDKAGRPKKQKGEAQSEAARKRVLAKYFGDAPGSAPAYADPAAFFGTS
jgi:hypothetical protein